MVFESRHPSQGHVVPAFLFAYGAERVQDGHINVVILAARLDGGIRNVQNFLVASPSEQGTAEQIVGTLAVALAFNSLFDHSHGFVMQFGCVEDPGLAYLHFGQVPAHSYSLAGSLASALDPDLFAAVIAIEHSASVSARGVRQGETGVNSYCVFEHLQGELKILAGLPSRISFTAQVEVVGLQVFRGLDGQGLQLLRRKCHAQGFGNLARYFVLYFENVLHLAVEALRPKRKVRVSVNELGIDAEAGAGAAQGASEDKRRAELLAD